jgi:hypothetical protein
MLRIESSECSWSKHYAMPESAASHPIASLPRRLRLSHGKRPCDQSASCRSSNNLSGSVFGFGFHPTFKLPPEGNALLDCRSVVTVSTIALMARLEGSLEASKSHEWCVYRAFAREKERVVQPAPKHTAKKGSNHGYLLAWRVRR